MMRFLGVMAAFFQRSWRLQNRFDRYLLFRAGTLVVSLLTFYYIGKLVPAAHTLPLAAYGGDYFAFVVVGMAFTGLLTVGMGGLAGTLNSERAQGTLETLLAAPLSVPMLALGLCSYAVVLTLMDIALYLILGVAVFGLDLSRANPVSAGILVVLSVPTFLGLGILTACSSLRYRRSGFLAWLAGPILRLAGGVYFPIAVLPVGCQPVCSWVPTAPVMEGLRRALLQGASLSEVREPVLMLLILGGVLVPASLAFLSRTIRRVKMEGTAYLAVHEL